jgi:F1F0 ATPase subunit 2
MIDSLELLFALAVGLVLGAIFFAGLWWTVQKFSASPSVALWFLGSMLLRMGLVLVGFYFLLGDSWQKMCAGLCGFIVARFIVMRIVDRVTRKSHPVNPLQLRTGYEP